MEKGEELPVSRGKQEGQCQLVLRVCPAGRDCLSPSAGRDRQIQRLGRIQTSKTLQSQPAGPSQVRGFTEPCNPGRTLCTLRRGGILKGLGREPRGAGEGQRRARPCQAGGRACCQGDEGPVLIFTNPPDLPGCLPRPRGGAGLTDQWRRSGGREWLFNLPPLRDLGNPSPGREDSPGKGQVRIT